METRETRESYIHNVPFVGRYSELSSLKKRLRNLCKIFRGDLPNKDPSLILISGEPGVGKTRLLQELRESVPSTEILFLEGNSSSCHVDHQ